MPVTIKTANLKYKNSQGQYVGVNTVGDNIDVDDSLTVAGAAAEAKKTGDEISELKNNIDKKSPAIYKNASGDIVTFDDAADGMPLSECVVQIDPVQDLHGYANPWPAGGGKNKFNPDSTDDIWVGTNGSISHLSSAKACTLPTTAGTTWTLSNANASSSNNILLLSFFDSSDVFLSRHPLASGATSVTATAPTDTAYIIASFYNWELAQNAQLEVGSTATAYAPYSNICPISGWTGAQVTRTGVNLFGGSAFKAALLGITGASEGSDSDGSYVTFAGSAAINRIELFNVFQSNKQYTVILKYKKNNTNTASNIGLSYTDGTETYINTSETAEEGKLYTAVISTNAAKSAAVLTAIYASGSTSIYYDKCGVFEGVLTAADFVPYQGQTYPISWQTAAGTVYSGTVDLKAQTLTVDRASVDLGTQDWNYRSNSGSEAFYCSLSGCDFGTENVSICSAYSFRKYITGLAQLSGVDDGEYAVFKNGAVLYMRNRQYADTTSFKTSLAWQTFVYPLATPLVYSLTDLPTILTLPGYNAIWSDTGAVAVTYPADTKAYVDDSIPSVPVQDVQVNGTSILSNGVANVPIASLTTLGVAKPAGMGININASGEIYLSTASSSHIKAGANNFVALTPGRQNESVFYGLAKLAGADMASSSNAVGTYTDAAKIAIQKMLGIYEAPWELIREDTFTNATEADHVITVDGNGNAFELTDVVMMFETPNQATESSKGYYGNIQYLHGSSVVFSETGGTWTQAANANAHGFTQFITRKDGLVFKSGSVNVQTGGQGQERIIYAEGFPNSSAYNGVVPASDGNTVTSINIKAVLGTGHYKLYGKRKWWT